MEKNKEVLELILLSVVATIAGVFGIGLPVVALSYPIILTTTGISRGIKGSSVVFLVSLLLVGLITRDINSLVILLQYGILSLVTAALIEKRFKVEKIIFITSSTLFLLVLIHIGLKWYLTGINTFVELDKSLMNIANEQIKLVRQGELGEAEMSQISNLLRSVSSFISSIIPALMVIVSTSIAYINYYISARISKKRSTKENVPAFSKIVFPRSVIKGFAVLLLLSYAMKYISGFNYMQLLDNIFVILSVVFLIEGLSLTLYVIDKIRVGKVLKVLFVVALFVSSFLNIVLFSLGMLDIIIDFRRLRRVENV